MGGTGGTSTDLTGLTPEQIAVIGGRRAQADAERTRIADLLRLRDQSKSKAAADAEALKIQQDQFNRNLALDKAKLRQKSLNDKGLLDLKSQEITQRINELKSLDEYRKGQNTAAFKRIDAQIKELESLDNYRAAQTFTDLEKLDISRQTLAMDQEVTQLKVEANEAAKTGDLARAKLLNAQAVEQETKNNLVTKYLENPEDSSDLMEAYAKKALGLPIASAAQERLRFKDASSAEVQLLDKDIVKSPEIFKVANEQFLANAPDSLDRFYVWKDMSGKLGASKAKQVPLPNGLTLKDVREDAVKVGVTVQQLLDEIYKKSLKQGV